jgi:hypothetical protein
MRTLSVLCLASAVYLFAAREKNPGLLWSFERADELRGITTAHARVTQLHNFATEGHYALQVDFEAVEQPQIELSSAAIRADWRPFGALGLDVTNPSEESLGFSLEVVDAAGNKSAAHTALDLQPHESGSYVLPLNSPPPPEMGMRGEPPIPGFHLMAEDHHPVDLSRMAKVWIFLTKPPRPRTLVFDNIRLASGVTYDKIADALGQYSREQWPGKLPSDAAFATNRAKEEAELKAHPALADRDEYGGWSSGPQLEGTGYFRTIHQGGKWWLVTPYGHLFFSLGFNSVNTGEGGTVVEGREQMFQWLPAPGDPLAKHYGVDRWASPVGLAIKFAQGRTFQFYTANLERKYGSDWWEQWKSITLQRLPAWGFNTIGNWSDPRLYEAKRVPYTATLDVEGKFAEVPSGTDYWKRMSDPFDPAFAEAADSSARKAVEQRRNDPWCIGYFVDNELSWGSMRDDKSRYGLALGALSLDTASPAKRAFIEQLQKRYRSVQEFNAAWATQFADWPALLEKPFHPADDFSHAMQEDLSAFVKVFAAQYFRIVRDALKKYDPNHLYLGTRFAGYTREGVEACAEFCDVLSFNIYRPRVEPAQWSFLNSLDKPVIVGEFHMGALDRGMFHPGLVKTRDQEARAAMFMDYVRSVVDNPAFVGCHYFKYADEPLTGRPGDGENYSIGFTTVVDGLYPEMIKAAKTVSGEMYTRRSRP